MMTKKYKKCKHRLKDSIKKLKNLTDSFNDIFQEKGTTLKRKLETMKTLIHSINDE